MKFQKKFNTLNKLPVNKRYKRFGEGGLRKSNKGIKKPLISRHVFVQVIHSNERSVFNSKSVNGYLNFHGQRAKVWPNEIQRLKDYCLQTYSPDHFKEGAVFKAPVLGTDAQLLSVDKNNMCSAISSCGRFNIKFRLAS